MYRSQRAAVCLGLLLASAVRAQPATPDSTARGPLVLTAERLAQSVALGALEGVWRFAPGDDLARAAPGFDDRTWTLHAPQAFDPVASGGVGWFRLPVRLKPGVQDSTFVGALHHSGASELYLDGRLLARFGQPAARAGGERTALARNVPVPLQLTPGRVHVLALRYSFHAWAPLMARLPGARSALAPGVSVHLTAGPPVAAVQHYTQTVTGAAVWASVTAGALLLLLLVNLSLFAFFREERAALYVAALSLMLALQLGAIHAGLFPFGRSAPMSALMRVATNALGQGILAGIPLVLYAVFLKHPPRWRPLIIAAGVMLSIACVFSEHPAVTYALMPLILVELVRVVGGAIRRGQEGAWIVGAGVLTTTVTTLIMIAGEVGGRSLMPYWALLVAGYLPIPTSFSLLLAYRFGRVSRSLRARLVEVEQLTEARAADAAERATLEAESRRKTEELEAARQTQLALLPHRLPIVPYAVLAAAMQTATEVGGDYYDAHLAPDGTLTLAIGDATGHGARAGTMVTATKALFIAHAGAGTLPDALGSMNAAVRTLGLRGLYMALTLVRITPDGRVRLVAAGMPLPVIVRAGGRAESVLAKGLPLGAAPPHFRYAEATFVLAPGDALVLVSDGLPERRRADGTFLGYDMLPRLAAEAMWEASAGEAVSALAAAANAFADGNPLDDDETLFVVRYTGTASPEALSVAEARA